MSVKRLRILHPHRISHLPLEGFPEAPGPPASAHQKLQLAFLSFRFAARLPEMIQAARPPSPIKALWFNLSTSSHLTCRYACVEVGSMPALGLVRCTPNYTNAVASLPGLKNRDLLHWDANPPLFPFDPCREARTRIGVIEYTSSPQN